MNDRTGQPNDGYTPHDLARALRELGIARGDCIFLHTSLKRLGTLRIEAQNSADAFPTLLAAFVDVVGDDGTLVVPTFNFGFCKGAEFDVERTPSEGMGAFSEYVRRHAGAIRSSHPFQSVAAIGKNAGPIASATARTAFSDTGPFDRMLTMNCKIVFLGIGFVETFVHVAEERAQVNYRFWKSFEGYVVDHGAREFRKVDFFARMLDLVPEPEIDNDKLERYFLQNGAIKRRRLGAGHVSVLSARTLVESLTKEFAADNRFALVAQQVTSLSMSSRRDDAGP